VVKDAEAVLSWFEKISIKRAKEEGRQAEGRTREEKSDPLCGFPVWQWERRGSTGQRSQSSYFLSSRPIVTSRQGNVRYLGKEICDVTE